MVLGVAGFVLMAIPFDIGWFVGGIPDVLAVIFGISGLAKRGGNANAAKGMAVVGLVLALLSLASVFVGAGSTW
jgi:hypothetical protein